MGGQWVVLCIPCIIVHILEDPLRKVLLAPASYPLRVLRLAAPLGLPTVRVEFHCLLLLILGGAIAEWHERELSTLFSHGAWGAGRAGAGARPFKPRVGI